MNFEAEIDLRPYLRSLLRYWWLILLVGGLVASAGLVYSLRQPVLYQASAMMIVTRTRPTLSLAEQFPTVNEVADYKSKIQAYLAIAKSDSIAESAYARLRDEHDVTQNITTIKNRVSIVSDGDAINITATANNPTQAAAIANTWAEEAAKAINIAYGKGRSSVEIDTQLSTAEEQYHTAQSELESFIASSQLGVIEQKIIEARRILENLTIQQTWKIDYYNERIRLMDQVISQAEALKEQLADSSQSSAGGLGDALAVLLARAETFGIKLNPSVLPHIDPSSGRAIDEPDAMLSSAPQFNISLNDLSVSGNTSQNFVSDIDALLARARAEKAKAEEIVNNLTDEVLSGQENELVARTAAWLSSLETQKERETALKNELTSERDLAWQAYSTLLQKKTEIQTASETSNEVSLASPAVKPLEPMSRNVQRNTLVAGVLGLIAGCVLVLVMEWWRQSARSQALAQAPVAKSVGSDQ